ncbi:protein BZR1 homolog 3-like isoform X2 [Typha angustifolia]|uniref:protein BZR1 homolog 3-like isoform X2 n=1 Tax=Typha angustifolia TaxID=59011 RepID=UPI003C307359
MTSGSRMPTWRERENNKRRERRRRAIAAKIYAGLRMYGGYKLPKHCDNNEVLKALCDEAGWTVEPDGTTYRKGCKPPSERTDVNGVSASLSPWSSYQPSPHLSYNPSPSSSSFPSSSSSSYIAQANNFGSGNDGSSPIPWAKNLSSASSSKFSQLHHLFLNGGSISAPVTPPLSSPTASTPRIGSDWDVSGTLPPWASAYFTSLPNSTPQSPGHQVGPDPAWLAAMQISSAGPSSPTRSLVSSNPFGPCKEVMTGRESSKVCTPGQSGTCSPVIAGGSGHTDVHMSGGVPDEFAFGSSINGNNHWTGLVKAWEGERIHEECGSDDLELTLGRSRTRADA